MSEINDKLTPLVSREKFALRALVAALFLARDFLFLAHDSAFLSDKADFATRQRDENAFLAKLARSGARQLQQLHNVAANGIAAFVVIHGDMKRYAFVIKDAAIVIHPSATNVVSGITAKTDAKRFLILFMAPCQRFAVIVEFGQDDLSDTLKRCRHGI